MNSRESKLKNISTEMDNLTLKRQHLLEMIKYKSVCQELMNLPGFQQTEGAVQNRHDINSIDEKLKQLGERKAELQRHDDITKAKDETRKEDQFPSCQMVEPGLPVPASKVVFIEAPPNIPAPTVILDVDKLPPCPCRTQCPECKQFVMTETSTSNSSVTWLACFLTATLGCVVGCCFIPFCIDKLKSTTHKCPKCRTSIATIKKL